MARHTFVTKLELTKKIGVVTDVEYYDDMVDIPSKSEIREIAKTAMSSELKKVVQSVESAAKTAKAAAMEASVAREEIARIVETARETFREVIEEMLAPHYWLLAQLLGVELPTEKMKQKIDTVKPRPTVVVKNKKDDAKSKSNSKTRKSVVRKKTAMSSKGKRTVAAKRNIAKKRPTSSSKAR